MYCLFGNDDASSYHVTIIYLLLLLDNQEVNYIEYITMYTHNQTKLYVYCNTIYMLGTQLCNRREILKFDCELDWDVY